MNYKSLTFILIALSTNSALAMRINTLRRLTAKPVFQTKKMLTNTKSTFSKDSQKETSWMPVCLSATGFLGGLVILEMIFRKQNETFLKGLKAQAQYIDYLETNAAVEDEQKRINAQHTKRDQTIPR